MSNPRTTKPLGMAHSPHRRPTRWLIIAGAVVSAAIALATVAPMVFSTRDGEMAAIVDQELSKQDPSSSRATTAPPNAHASETGISPADRVTLVEDDGKTLWVSPTSGPPLDLAYLPPGTQIIVALRPAALASHPEDNKVIDALGPIGFRGAQILEDVLLEPHGVAQAVIGCYVTSDGSWKTTLAVRLSGRTATEHLAEKLPNATEKSHNGETYWLTDGRAYYLPAADDDMLLVVAPEESIAEIISLGGLTPPLRRDTERLLAHTDAGRHVTIIVAPNSLFSEGQSMFSGTMAGLRDPLFWFLGDELSAAALSLHWNENFFIELIATPTLDTSPERASRILGERLVQVPDKLQEFIAGLEPQTYSRDIVSRFPDMVRTMVAYTRSGFDSDHAVLRCYLPAVAGHNLIMGAELTLAETKGAARTVAEANAPLESSSSKLESVRARLQRDTSLRFARDTLEAALEQLAQDTGMEIVIRGADLQAEGITKNQSFGIDIENKPAADILLEILRLANPDKTATGPSDVRQKLVYVIAPSRPDGSEQIVVTTRAAAAQRGDDLPAVFRPD